MPPDFGPLHFSPLIRSARVVLRDVHVMCYVHLYRVLYTPVQQCAFCHLQVLADDNAVSICCSVGGEEVDTVLHTYTYTQSSSCSLCHFIPLLVSKKEIAPPL